MAAVRLLSDGRIDGASAIRGHRTIFDIPDDSHRHRSVNSLLEAEHRPIHHGEIHQTVFFLRHPPPLGGKSSLISIIININNDKITLIMK